MQATKFELVINAEIPRILGLTVPPTLLATSKRVAQRSVVYRVLNAVLQRSRDRHPGSAVNVSATTSMFARQAVQPTTPSFVGAAVQA
jgi:hypothetical protein